MKTLVLPSVDFTYKTSLWTSSSRPGVLFPILQEDHASMSGDASHLWSAPIAGALNLDAPPVSKDVLIVEDEPYLCDLIADVLESEGHQIRKAANGLDALAIVADSAPQLILLDLMMPIMDGWEFMSALRANADWQNIPIVIITAVYDVARTQLETGAKAIVTKPFDIDQLADIVRLFAS